MFSFKYLYLFYFTLFLTLNVSIPLFLNGKQEKRVWKLFIFSFSGLLSCYSRPTFDFTNNVSQTFSTMLSMKQSEDSCCQSGDGIETSYCGSCWANDLPHLSFKQSEKHFECSNQLMVIVYEHSQPFQIFIGTLGMSDADRWIRRIDSNPEL